MFNDNENASILNDLIATTIDSAEGYREAAEDATEKRYQLAFQERAHERQDAVLKLKNEVRRLGEEPEDDGTILAGAHRVFMDLKQLVTTNDDKAIITSVEQGEDHIKEKYEDVLKNDDLDPACRAVVQDCYTSVQQGHAQMSALQNRVTD